MVIDWTQVLLTLIAALLGGGAFYGFLRATRAATSDEYKQFVEDLQQERRDRERALRKQEKRQRQSETRIAQLTLELADLNAHIARLELEVQKLGGTPPARPPARAWPEFVDEDDDLDERETPPSKH